MKLKRPKTIIEEWVSVVEDLQVIENDFEDEVIEAEFTVITSLEQLEEVGQARIIKIDIPERQISLLARGLTGQERGKLMSRGGKVVMRKDGSQVIDLSQVKGSDAYIASCALVKDYDGTPMYSDDRKAQGKRSKRERYKTPEERAGALAAEILDPVVKAVRKISGLDKDAVEEEKKDS